jgi:hypothetical protein
VRPNNISSGGGMWAGRSLHHISHISNFHSNQQGQVNKRSHWEEGEIIGTKPGRFDRSILPTLCSAGLSHQGETTGPGA